MGMTDRVEMFLVNIPDSDQEYRFIDKGDIYKADISQFTEPLPKVNYVRVANIVSEKVTRFNDPSTCDHKYEFNWSKSSRMHDIENYTCLLCNKTIPEKKYLEYQHSKQIKECRHNWQYDLSRSC